MTFVYNNVEFIFIRWVNSNKQPVTTIDDKTNSTLSPYVLKSDPSSDIYDIIHFEKPDINNNEPSFHCGTYYAEYRPLFVLFSGNVLTGCPIPNNIIFNNTPNSCWSNNFNDSCVQLIKNISFEQTAIKHFEYNGCLYWFIRWVDENKQTIINEDQFDPLIHKSPYTKKENIENTFYNILYFDTDISEHTGTFIAEYGCNCLEEYSDPCHGTFRAIANGMVVLPKYNVFDVIGNENGCWENLKQNGCTQPITPQFVVTATRQFIYPGSNILYKFMHWLDRNGNKIQEYDETKQQKSPWVLKSNPNALTHQILVFENDQKEHCGVYTAYYYTDNDKENLKRQISTFIAPIEIVKIATGHNHTIALEGTVHPDDRRIILSYTRVWSWGKNNYGQLGLGNYDDKDYPHIITFPNNELILPYFDEVELNNNFPKFNINITITGNGSVVSDPAGIRVTSGFDSCTYNKNTITLYAHPRLRNKFVNWTGDITSSNNKISLNLGQPINLPGKILFVTGSNKVKCPDYNSYMSADIGDWIYQKFDTYDLICKITNKILDPANNIYEFVLDKNYAGTTTSSLSSFDALTETAYKIVEKTYNIVANFSSDDRHIILHHIDAGMDHSLGIDQYGRGWSWGDNQYCQLGIDQNVHMKNIPTLLRLDPKERLKDLKGGSRHTIGITFSNKVYIWGHSRCGDVNTTPDNDPKLIDIPEGLEFDKVFIGSDYYAGLTLSGELYMWGNNIYGQLGIGNFQDQNIPQKVLLPNNIKIVDVSLHSSHTLALDEYGQIWTWGRNNVEQLGNRNKINRNSPYHMTGFSLPALPIYNYPTNPSFQPYILDHTNPFYTVNITTSNGYVISDPGGINCDNNCSFEFNENEVIELYAIPKIGYTFIRWEGDLIDTSNKSSIIVNKNLNITAIFERKTRLLNNITYYADLIDDRYWINENNVKYWIDDHYMHIPYGNQTPIVTPFLYYVSSNNMRHIIFEKISTGDGYSYAWDYLKQAYTWGLNSPYHKYTVTSNKKQIPSCEKLNFIVHNVYPDQGTVYSFGNTSANKLNNITCPLKCIDLYLRNSEAKIDCRPNNNSVLTKWIIDNKLEIIHLGTGAGYIDIFKRDQFFEISIYPDDTSELKRVFGNIYSQKHNFILIEELSDKIQTLYIDLNNNSDTFKLTIDSKYFTVEDSIAGIWCKNQVKTFYVLKNTYVNLQLKDIKTGYIFKGWTGAGLSHTSDTRTIKMDTDHYIYLEWDNTEENIMLLNYDPTSVNIIHNGISQDDNKITVSKYGTLELTVQPIGSNQLLSFEYENVIIELYYGQCDFKLSVVNNRLIIEPIISIPNVFEKWEGEYAAIDGSIISVNISERKRKVSLFFQT